MEKLTCELSDGDTSAEERGKTVRDEKKVRTRKKKRKRHLTDLHQRLFKSRKVRIAICMHNVYILRLAIIARAGKILAALA